MPDPIQPKVTTLYYKDFAKDQPLLESGLYELGVIRMLDTLAFNQEKYFTIISDLNKDILELRKDYKNLSEAFDDHERYTVSLEERIEKLVREVNWLKEKVYK